MSLLTLLFIIEFSFTACPNGCSGHGKCTNEGKCVCFGSIGLGINERNTYLPSFTEPDCSLRTCPQGSSFSALSKNSYTESGILLRSIRELSGDEGECSLNIEMANTSVVNVKIDNPASSRLNFGGTLDCKDKSNINAYTCEPTGNDGSSCCLIEGSESGDATETDTQADNYQSCFFSFQNFDLSLVYSLKFSKTDNNYNYATIEKAQPLFDHYEFEENYDYRFACITDTKTKAVEVYYANYKAENDKDVKFTFNSTKAKPEGLCFMIVGCMGYNSNENCTIGNLPLIESQVYINFMRTENFIYYFEKIHQANKHTSILSGLVADYPKDGNSVQIYNAEGNKWKILDIDGIPIDDTLRTKGTYIRLDVLFGDNIFQGLSQLVVGSRIEMMKIKGGRIVIEIYRVRKLEFIDEDGNKVDKYGNILKYRNGNNDDDTTTEEETTSRTSRMLYEDRELADNNNNNNNSTLPVIIAVILTDPELLTINEKDSDIIISFTKSENGHVTVECSGAGKCNRQTGQCECYGGYEGEACERMGCQNNCNNHGRCVAFYELFKDQITKDDIADLKSRFGFFGNDANPKFYGCKCEEGYRGPDCSLRECPSSSDPQYATNLRTQDGPDRNSEHRDCSGRGICDYTTGICKCHDGYTGAGCELMLSVM